MEKGEGIPNPVDGDGRFMNPVGDFLGFDTNLSADKRQHSIFHMTVIALVKFSPKVGM